MHEIFPYPFVRKLLLHGLILGETAMPVLRLLHIIIMYYKALIYLLAMLFGTKLPAWLDKLFEMF